MTPTNRLLGLLTIIIFAFAARTASATSYYVNCSATHNGNGTMSSPWNTLSSPNSHTFVAGDQLLFLRGKTCNGQLRPLGSGTSSSYITISTYGQGALPIINGGSNNAVVQLTNQSDWTIANLKITAGVLYGVYITASTPISGINLINLDVSGATGTSDHWNSGEVMLTTGSSTTATISNVTINGVTAHDSHVSEGIEVQAGNPSSQTGVKGSNIVVENSLGHDVYGDGIVVLSVNSGVLQGNVVYNSGLCTTCTGSSPVGIWEFDSTGVIIQNNESYSNSSWQYDGGGFDLDYWSSNDTAQYNYAHDNQGYCLTALGSASGTSTNLVLRYNVCSNNIKSNFQGEAGDIVVFTWNGGAINGIQVYNNTSYFNPALNVPAIDVNANLTGTVPNFVKNNLVYSTASQEMMRVTNPGSVSLDYNLYYTTSGSLTFNVNGNYYTGFPAYQAALNQESHSLNVDPLLNGPTYHGVGMPVNAFTPQTGSPVIDAGTAVCFGITACSPGSRDFFNVPIPLGLAFDIGAAEYSAGRFVNVDDSTRGTGLNQFNFTGTWSYCPGSCAPSYPTQYLGTTSTSSVTNSVASIAFSGPQIAFTGVTGPDAGIAGVSIDGGSEVNIDFYATSAQGNQLLYTSPFLSPGNHTLNIRVTGTHNASSTANNIVLDHAEITTANVYKVFSVLSSQDLSVSNCTTQQSPIVQWVDGNATCQQWAVSPVSGGYTLVNQNGGLYLTDPSPSGTPGTQLDQENGSGANNQKWQLVPVIGLQFTYNLTNVQTGFNAGVSYDAITEGEPIVAWTASQSDISQQWVLVPTN